MRNTIVFAIFAIFVFACSTSVERKITATKFQPPIENVDVQFKKMEIDATKEQSISLETGSKVTIPANTFVDEKGNPVDKVSVDFREINSVSEIIASGIPMHYDSAGVRYDFETGGMFEIKVTADGKPVYIKDGKSINIEAGQQVDGKYNLYAYNTDQSGWNIIQASLGKVVDQKESIKAQLKELQDKMKKPMKPIKYFSDKDLVLDMKIDYSKFDELKKYKISLWKYVNTADSAKVNCCVWKDKDLERVENENMVYKLKLKGKGTAANAELMVSPVLSGDNYTKALQVYDEQLREYAEMERLKLQLENEVYMARTFNITKLGAYNWDCIHAYPNKVLVDAKISVEQSVQKDFTAYLITGNNKVIVKYDGSTFLGYNPDEKNVLLVILPSNKVAVVKDDYFKNLKFQKEAKNQHTFNAQPLNASINSVKDLDAIIKSL